MDRANRFVWLIILLSLFLVFSGCAPSDVQVYPSQNWEDIKITMETRPSRVEKGMNEFLIIATRPPRRPASDLIVSLRINDTGKWHQGIQDGHVGVYRRATIVKDPLNDILTVKIEYDNREGLLNFPLDPGAL